MTSTIHQRFVSRLPSLEQEMGEELFVSGLVGPYRIFQRKNGHRHGIDDATTAWYALQKTPPRRRSIWALELDQSGLRCSGRSARGRSGRVSRPRRLATGCLPKIFWEMD